MKRSCWSRSGSMLVGAGALLVALAGCRTACGTRDGVPAPQPGTLVTASPQDARKDPTEFRPLFDGKSLGMWKTTDFGGKVTPRVEHGAIILPAGSMLTGVTYTGTDYPKINYEIELEAQRVEGGDFFCGLTFPVRDTCASLILGGWGGSLCGISSLDGGDAANNETTKMVAFTEKTWYVVRMRVEENRLMAWLDREKIVDARTKGRRIDVRFEVEPSKPLGIATYATTGALRNIRIRALRPDELSKDTDE